MGSFNTAQGRAEYIASASQTDFAFRFKIFTNADVKVYLTPSGQDPDDVTDLLTLTVDYTVTIDGDNGGTMTLLTGANAGDAVTIVRSLEIKRDTEYQQNGDLTAEALNNDQDYQSYLIADAEAKKNRSLTLPESAQGANNIIPAPAANHYLKWDANAENFVNDPLTELNPADYTKLLHTVGNGSGNPEGYRSSEIDTAVASRRKLYAKETDTHDIDTDADYTLTTTQNLFGRIKITDSLATLTTARNIIVDTSVRDFIAVNDTAQDLTFKTLVGTGITVKAGKEVRLYNDGTNVVYETIVPYENQTWQDVSGSRAVDVTYTNTTGKVIKVRLSVTATSAGGAVQFQINGVVKFTLPGRSVSPYVTTTTEITILPGETYLLVGGAVSAIGAWDELR